MMASIQDDLNYFDHDADIGIIGRGQTVEQSFQAAAQAMFAVMTNLLQVQPVITVEFDFEEADLELALITWLNKLIAFANAKNCVLSQFLLRRDANKWHAKVSGQPWAPDMERGVEVKGATMTMLSVRNIEGGWEARCVVDV